MLQSLTPEFLQLSAVVTNIFRVAADNVPTRDIIFDRERLKLSSTAFIPGVWENFVLTRQLCQGRETDFEKVRILLTFTFPPILNQQIR
jgi:hypothetical protein